MLLASILPNVASLNPTHPALKYKNETLTYEQLLRQASSVAHGFRELGVQPGDRVALLSHPSSLLVVAEIAAVAIGAIPVAIFPGLTSSDIAQILQDADPIAVVYDSSDLKLSECIASLVTKRVAVNAIPCKASHAFSPSIESLIATCPPLGQWYEANPDDVALLIYTGGTTGRSKGVMHSHRTIRSWSFMNPERGGGHFSSKKMILPNQAHLTGQFILWTTLYEGGCLIFSESYPLQAEEALALIEREQLKNVGTVGLLFKDIVDLKNLSPECARSVEGISCGGAPVSESTFRQARERFPNAHLTEVYSQTESGQFISYLSINQCFDEGKLNRLLSVGKPSDVAAWGQKPFKVHIVDESGNDVSLGHTGEIICRGDQMMLGYWNNPEETDKVLRNGWLHTGDLGCFDQDGYLYLLDRKKDMIIVNGANVYCSEVEAVLSTYPLIVEIAVIGTPLPVEGEEVTAVVVLAPGSKLTIGQLQAFVQDRIAPHKIPTRMEIVESLARTSVGKIDKAAIRRPFWAGRTRMIN